MVEPEIIGAIAAGLVTVILAIIAALKHKHLAIFSDGEPGLRVRIYQMGELRSRIEYLERALETCDRERIRLMERLTQRD